MKRVLQYVHTIRYLKPIQVFGRIWFRLYSPSVRATPPLPVRRHVGGWQQPPLKPPSLLSPSHFRFLNEEHEINDPSDWNHPVREKLWLYHLHYFDDLNADGGVGRTDWHKALIERWIAENPFNRGNGWEPYPLSRRIVNWVKWAWGGSELIPGAAESLAVQARFLRQRLEWHLLGNHLLANAKALIFAGLFFEGTEADGWLTTGASIFSRQLEEQVLADGGHFELSPMYHAQVLEDLLDVINAYRAFPGFAMAGKNRGAAPSFFETQCSDAARRMLGWMKVMSHPDGEIALLNDSAFGAAADASALEAYENRLGIQPGEYAAPTDSSAGPARITYLKDTGYIRVDCGDMTAFLDVAPIGPDYLPGHAHADTLSFELSLGRQRVIVDSGVSRYGDGPERVRQRGTAAHNTVQINGQDSSEVWGGFRVARRAYPKDLRINASEGLVACAHDGYRRLPGKPVHRREWRFRKGGMEIRDTIEGDFREAVGRLHFHPDVRLIPIPEDTVAAAGIAASARATPAAPPRTGATGAESSFCNEGRILLPGGREMRWRIEKGRGRLCEKSWHPEFGLSIPNQCLEIHFADRETVVVLSWK